MAEQGVTEYRLGELEKQQRDFRQETKDSLAAVVKRLDELPDKLDQRYALRSDFEGYVEDQKTKQTGNRALRTGLTIAGFGVVLTAFISFMVWVVNVLVHVQNLGGTP